MIDVDPEAAAAEKIEVLIEDGILAGHGNQPKISIEAFRKAIKAMEDIGAPGKTHLSGYVCTCSKLAVALNSMNNPEAEEWWDRIITLQESVKKEACDNPDEYKGALTCVIGALLQRSMKAFRQKDRRHALQYTEDAVQLIEQFNAAEDDWETQFEVYSNHAFLIEDDNLDTSLRDYRKALTIARNHHLDQHPRCAIAVAVQNNNYAWVLWNKCGSEEAILYYGRALDLLESYLFSGIADRETVLSKLKHMGGALYDIYTSTNREKEAERLKNRLAENGVNL